MAIPTTNNASMGPTLRHRETTKRIKNMAILKTLFRQVPQLTASMALFSRLTFENKFQENAETLQSDNFKTKTRHKGKYNYA